MKGDFDWCDILDYALIFVVGALLTIGLVLTATN